MKILLFLVVIAGVAVLSFWLGSKWQGAHLGTAKKYVSEKSISLWSQDSGQSGVLPKGAVLYDASKRSLERT